MILKAGILQFQPMLGENDINRRAVEHLLWKADKADLYLLPELANSGYNFRSMDEAYKTSEEISNSPYIETLHRFATEREAHVVAGINDLSTVYRDNTEFVWREEFEDEAFAIVKGPEGEVDIARTSPPDSPEAFTDENSEYSGVAVLGSDNSRMVLQSDDGNDGGFELRKGNFIFLELHYRTDVPLITGLFINQQNQFIQKRPFVGLNPTDEWKKVYINFTPLVNEEVGAVDFRVYFEANASEGQAGSEIYLDNIKLLSRQNLKLSDE